ncbi:hypothetical protein ADM96_30560 [Burkholderia sp. ST111]|nr:hypothetical protein ADM96_30560 [Burkholderia sp. ST111]
MYCQQLASLPCIPNDGCLADVASLLENIQLACGIDAAGVSDVSKPGGVTLDSISNVQYPIVGDTYSHAVQCCVNASAP